MGRKGFEAETRAYTVRRRLQERGGSLLVTLPKVWTVAQGLKDGDEVFIQFDGFAGLLVLPALEDAAGKVSVK